MDPITPKQRKCLDAVERICERKGGFVGSSYKELAGELGVTNGAVVVMVERLIAGGHLKRIPPMPRTLKLAKARVSA
jgi:DNA-binding MarR family transcriptional regulator